MANKTDYQQFQNPELAKMRHTAEHLLHDAARILWPNVKLAMGPATDDGFYFDFDPVDEKGEPFKVSEEDFAKLEEKMQWLKEKDLPLREEEISLEEAKELFGENEYKIDTLEKVASRNEKVENKERITVYWTGDKDLIGGDISKLQNGYYIEGENFVSVDLCAGPHVESTGRVGEFTLLSVAGAYWQGDEKNKMLTRIYGTAFPTQKELETYLWQQEEAKKRDHRTLGKQLEIYTIADEVGQGLILWQPKGALLRELIEDWAKQTEKEWGYERVFTPHITKKELYEISGHLPFYADDMYSPLDIEGEEYYLKPMNCPHHHMIYRSKLRSYRELPLRLTEYGQLYRYENSGTLHGLMRVRGFCQNDAHIYVQPENAVEEFVSVFNMHEYYYDTLGIDTWWVKLGLRDKENLRKKYHGDDEMWGEAEDLTRQALDKAGVEYEIDEGGAAHYGPKGDIFVKSVIGKEYAIGTVQLDLFMPRQFNLRYVDTDGVEKMPYIIHRAPLGSHERFIGFLLEHFAGAFPVWLHPVQVKILPIGMDQFEYAHEVHKRLLDTGIRAEEDVRNESLNARIRDAQMEKVPYMLIIGKREMENGTVSVRLRTEADVGEMGVGELVERVKEKIETKSLELF